MRPTLLALLLTAAAALPVPGELLAQPVARLAWDHCAGLPGASTAKAFSGPAVYRQVVSASGLAGPVRGFQVTLRLRSAGGVPDAWRLDAAGCQAGRVAVATAAASKACPSLAGLSSIQTTITHDAASGSIDLRLSTTFATVEAGAGTNYTLFRLDHDLGAATAGPTVPGASCGGADQPVCFSIVEALWLDAAFVEHDLAIAGGSVTWNDGAGTTACTDVDLDAIRIDEMMTACASGDMTLQFVELVADRPATFSSRLGLRLRTREGDVVLDAASLFPGREDQPWAPGTRWLIATAGFQEASGVTPDVVLPLAIDPTGGSILLTDARPGAPVVHALEYGRPGEPAAPGPGHSLRREPGGAFAESASPDPTNAAGTTATTFLCRSTAAGVRIQEFAIDCAGCDPQNRPFVELVATAPGQRYAAGLRLRVLGAGGAVLFDGGGLFPAGVAGAPWPEGGTWLLGSPASVPSPDRNFASALPAGGGTLRLYDPEAGGAVVSEVRYGPGGFPAPAPGRSLARQAEDRYVEEAVPTPTRSDGQRSAAPGCYPTTPPPPPPMAGTRFAEIGLACAQGDARSQFIELVSTVDQVLEPGLRLRVRHASGVVVFVATDPFAARPAGTPWPAGSRWLLATAAFAEATGLVPDGVLPALLPAGAATLTLEGGDECAPQSVDEVAYGVPGAVPPPAPGRSLERQPGGTLVETATVSPTRFDGATTAVHACACPLATLTCGPDTVPHEEPAAGLECAQGAARYDLAHGTFEAFTWGQGSSGTAVDAGDDYTITGLPAGTNVSFAAQVEITADACGGYDGGGFAWGRVRDGTNEVLHKVSASGRGNCDSDRRTLRLELQKAAGTPFRLQIHAAAGGDTEGSGSVAMRFAFVDLPPGTRVTSCHGFVQDAPTATRTTIVDQQAAAGAVRLAWHSGAGGNLEGVVERRTEHTDWAAVATLRSNEAGRFDYADDALDSGGRFGFRLGVLHDGVRDWSDPAWVDVPSSLRFAIQGVAPNPASSDASLAFVLEKAGPVRIEVIDVQGRLALALDPRVGGVGRHVVRLAGSGRLAAGVYVVRLIQGTEVRTTKFTRVR